MANSFESLSEKNKKEALPKSWGNKSEPVDMLNWEYTPCLGSLFTGDVECAVSNFFNLKHHFNQLSWERVQGLGHASPLDCKRGSHKANRANDLIHHKPHNSWVRNRGIKWKVSRSQRNMQPSK